MPKNHYNDPRIQKRLPKQEDEQYQYTGMKINSHFLLCAGTGCGKTNALYDYILQTSEPKKGTFKKIFLCYKTDEPFYDDLKEQLGKQFLMFKSVAELPRVDDFQDATKEVTDKFLVIFDDCINDKDKVSYKKIDDYFTYGRKKNITICYLSQSFFDTDRFLRKQISYLLLLSIKGKRELRTILKDYGSVNVTVDELERIFEEATKPRDDDEMPFLKITCRKCPKNEMFSRDWIEYFQLEDI